MKFCISLISYYKSYSWTGRPLDGGGLSFYSANKKEGDNYDLMIDWTMKTQPQGQTERREKGQKKRKLQQPPTPIKRKEPRGQRNNSYTKKKGGGIHDTGTPRKLLFYAGLRTCENSNTVQD